MSIIKNLLAKAGKPQDQTCASSLQQTIDHMLADPTTGLNKAIEEANTSALLYGSSMIQIGPSKATITAGPYITHIGKSATISRTLPQGYPRQINLRSTDLDKHPAFELTVEQLRGAWMLAYGTRWVSMETPLEDDYLNVVAQRLVALGEVETHNVIDQYAPMARIKV